MSLERVRDELLTGGLHEPSVIRLLDHYQRMQTRLREGEYDEAGTHIGNFCENMVNLLRDQMGEGVQDRPNLGEFVNHCIAGNIGSDEPDSVRLQIPRTLRAAYEIRNRRDTVHVNLRVPVNQADTQAGVAMCSWMLAEVLRVYGVSDDTDDMSQVAELIRELSKPVTERNPLKDLEASRTDFDRRQVVDSLDGTVQIVAGEVRPGPGFDTLDTPAKVVALLLGRRAAADLGHLESVGTSASWFSDHVGVTPARIRQIAGEVSFISNDTEEDGYHIPGFRIDEAVKFMAQN